MAEGTKIDEVEQAWICKQCQEVFENIFSYVDHLESKEHEQGIMKRKYSQKYLKAKAILDEKTGKKTSTPNEDQKVSDIPESESKSVKTSEELSEDDSDSDEDEVYTCEICKKICTGIINFKLHMQGRKHRKRVKENAIMKELKEKKITPETYKSPDDDILSQLSSSNIFKSSTSLMCKVCNVRCSGPGALKQHYNGESHKKKEAGKCLLQKMKDEGVPVNKPAENIVGKYSCAICQKAFSGIVPYKQHLESGKHSKQERGLQSLNKLENLYIPSETSSKIICKECNKTFSGVAPFEEHVKSPSHKKMKKKNDLFKELKKNHPEMVSMSVKADSESEDSDNTTIKPACAVCNMIFSGPEVAMDHFSSENHTKLLKKKLRIEKHKNEEKKKYHTEVVDVAKSFEML